MKIYRANIIYTPEPSRFRMLEHGYIAVNDEGIILGVYDTLPDMYRGQIVTDYGDSLLIPAFCDLHVHAPQYRNLGLALDEELLPWLNKYTFPEESKFKDPAYAERIYRRFVHELWMQGTMRSAVFATCHTEATRRLMNVFREANMGAMVGLTGMDRNSPDDLRNTVGDIHEFYTAEAQQMVSVLGDKLQPLVRPILTPRFIPSCSQEMLREFGSLAQQYHLPVQSHLSENRSEIEWVKELEPESDNYGDAYNRYGLFGQTPTLMAHCCYTDGAELQLMQQNKVYVVHCPTSNSNLASGIAPIRKFLSSNIPVALGSDVSAGHYMSMLRVIQYAIQMSKLQYARSEGQVPFLTLSEAFYLATKSGGSFFGRVGSFEAGYEFDALLIDDRYLNYDSFSLEHRVQRFLYLGDDRDIRRRWCRGKELVEPVM